MCGRLVNFTDAEHLAALFDVADLGPLSALRPSYNLPPSRELYAITGIDTGDRTISVKRWGFVPAWWAKSLNEALKPSNARGETVVSSPLFRDSFRSRRCLIPVDAFYEWRQADKVPHVFRPVVGGVFALGGIWDVWTDTETGERRDTFAVITTGPNSVTAPVHERMPVILSPDDWAAWLDPATPLKDAKALARPCPTQSITAHRVAPAVGSVRNDGPRLLEPYTPPAGPVDLFADVA